MFARAAVIFGFIALAFPGHARAQDVPACSQYQEPMAYNACLARHGPKANDVATRPAYGQHGRSAMGPAERGRAGAAKNDGRGRSRAMRLHRRVHIEFPVK